MDPILSVRDLCVDVGTGIQVHRVLDGVSLDLFPGKTLGVVGESGCGKSMTALATMGLLPDRFSVASGSIQLAGEEMTTIKPARLRQLRGNMISMIFQELMTSLNPLLTVERQIAEVVEPHQHKTKAREIALEMLRAIPIPSPEDRLAAYPHELLGRMRQRVMIAIALACRPKVIIADEPTTALDVTVQAQIFRLLRDLQMDTETAIMLITHDLGAVAEMADEVAVFCAGKSIESGPVGDILDRPAHPYTRGLMSRTPRLKLGAAARLPDAGSLGEIPGMVPPLGRFPKACRFAPRCALADERCRSEDPPRLPVGTAQTALCWYAKEEALA
ncbi:ABC transporter ATP-binding protein [Pseudooceanicola atlanticus]|nr:ABC transporter ATP-binding protein [Pseudooceanicola atlanticus]